MKIIRVKKKGAILGYEVIWDGEVYHIKTDKPLVFPPSKKELNDGLIVDNQRGVDRDWCSMISCQKKGAYVFENDKVVIRSVGDNNEPIESRLNVFFEHGAFWVDESFAQDKTFSTLLNQYQDIELA